MKNKIVAISCLLLCAFCAKAQDSTAKTWWNPATATMHVLEGRAWPVENTQPFARLPLKAQATVPPEVWDLSRQAAGLMIRFKTSSPEVTIRYQVERPIALPHMPATGVSGVDLYYHTSSGKELWAAGKWSFKDTIEYNYSKLQPGIDGEYHLYLPLYNVVKWMEIGTRQGSTFTPLPGRTEKPIVVYGTSIAQGACASRPGMAWTAILSRQLNMPLINLGFSGNGRLDEGVNNLLTEIQAAVYVLDCLPNLAGNRLKYDDKEIYNRLINAGKRLRTASATVPILLTDHFGYTDSGINPEKKMEYERVNRINHEAFAALKKEGVKNLYLLDISNLKQNIETMVDGTHPTDYGMTNYANAYAHALKSILKN